ncbi:MAG: hypothetical protein IJX65_02555 [Alistipes sp.]|nr:hypothetical protein [Alistipes sp.]
MKRLALLILTTLFGINLSLAQERHYSFRYIGTAYKTQSGGTTTMTDKSSSCKLPSNFTASFLPDHKTVWLYGSGINEKLTGSGKLSSGGYDFSSGASWDEILGMMAAVDLPTSSYTLFTPGDYSKIMVTSFEINSSNSDYYRTRFDYYNRVATVSAPHNSKRIEAERKEAEQKARSEQFQRESAEREARESAAMEAHDRALKNSIGKPFPMAYFVDSHGNRVNSSYFKRGKKMLVVTYKPGCKPNLLLKELLKGYPEIASQVLHIYRAEWRYSEHQFDTSAPLRTDRIYYNPSEENNRNWIYAGTYPCIILLDEWGNVLSYKFGYSREEDMGYMMRIINQLRGRDSSGAPYQIGDYYSDGKTEGIVFEVYNNGYSGKIVSLKHSDNIKRWRERGLLDIGKSFGVTDGRDIMYYREVAESVTEDDAFGWCYRLGKDWYLPTIDELKAIYKNKSIIEPKLIHKLERYWSCTEQSAEKAYYIEKGSGVVFASEKYYGCRIRAVKCFGNVPRKEQKSTSAPYKVGDFYNENGKCGVVFEVNADGTSGKISTIKPLPSRLRWASDEDEASRIVGANSTTDGAYNMAAVQRIPNWQSKYPLFETCANLGKGWYIPAINEVTAIYESRHNGAVPISNAIIWSSTESYNYKIYANAIDFYNGRNNSTEKDVSNCAYAVTTFGDIESKSTPAITHKPTSAPYKVGSLYNEDGKQGVVIEVWDNGCSGKIISLTESLMPWSEAKESCKALGEGWYLPSAEELRLLSYDKSDYEAISEALKQHGSPLSTKSNYWSSTATGETIHRVYPTAYTIKIGGKCSQEPTCNGYYIRAMATFGTTPRPTTTLIRPKTSAPYNVGDYYNDGVKDGIVFEATAGGFQGKIVSINESMSKICWAKDWYTYYGAKSKTDGAYNMKVIKSATNNLEDLPAFKWCADLGEEWYLPSAKELQAIYKCRKIVNKNSSHWSSTESKMADKSYKEYSDYDRRPGAFSVYKDEGKVNSIAKLRNHRNSVRAVAKF